MSLLKTNLPGLDKLNPVEVVLELNSFAGGENTLGSDKELTENECRRMENWEVYAITGMQRANGFQVAASGLNQIGEATFTGTGLNDIAPSGSPLNSQYVEASGTSTFTVTIDGVTGPAVPDTFSWYRDSILQETGIPIPLASSPSGYMMEDNVYVKFISASGHTNADSWTFRAISYQDNPDLVIQHAASGNVELYAVVEGDLVKKSGSNLLVEDENAFTDGTLCHGVSIHDQLWITNATDNLKNKVMGGDISTPSSVPVKARSRIYHLQSRLIAEGGGKEVYGSRVQPGNWKASNAWTLVNDAWSITMPDVTQGMAIGFPSGRDATVFTEQGAFSLYNFPNVAYEPIPGGHGCSAPYSIAVGEEGVYFVSRYPSLGVFLWNGSNWQNLTLKQDFVNDINFSQRIFGVYRNRKYYLLYASRATGVSDPDVMKVYDAQFGRWYTRTVNSDYGDTFGHPAVLVHSNKELYLASSQIDWIYDFDNATITSDNGYNTVATYETKNFTSSDFSLANGAGKVPIDEVRIKLTKMVMIAEASNGVVTLNWVADRGLHTGSQTIGFSTTGSLLNDDFIMNESIMNSGSQDRTAARSFSNKAVGRRFNFQVNNSGVDQRHKVKKIKIHGILLEEQ